MVGGVVSALMTNLDVGIVEVLELIGDLSNVSKIGLKWVEVVRVIGMFSLLLGVEEAFSGLLSGHPAVPLDCWELLRAVWAAASLGNSSL